MVIVCHSVKSEVILGALVSRNNKAAKNAD